MSHLRSILEFFESYYKPVCTSPVKSYILCIRWLMFFPLFLGKVNAINTYSKSSGYAVFGSSKPCIVKLNQNFPCMFVDLSLNIWYQFSIGVPSNLFWINLNSPFLFPIPHSPFPLEFPKHVCWPKLEYLESLEHSTCPRFCSRSIWIHQS